MLRHRLANWFRCLAGAGARLLDFQLAETRTLAVQLLLSHVIFACVTEVSILLDAVWPPLDSPLVGRQDFSIIERIWLTIKQPSTFVTGAIPILCLLHVYKALSWNSANGLGCLCRANVLCACLAGLNVLILCSQLMESPAQPDQSAVDARINSYIMLLMGLATVPVLCFAAFRAGQLEYCLDRGLVVTGPPERGRVRFSSRQVTGAEMSLLDDTMSSRVESFAGEGHRLYEGSAHVFIGKGQRLDD